MTTKQLSTVAALLAVAACAVAIAAPGARAAGPQGPSAGAVGAPKFSAAPGVGFRAQWISP